MHPALPPVDRRAVVAASILMGLALVWYSFLVPAWRAPDEVSHVDLVLDVARDGEFPAWDENRYRLSVLRAAELVGPLNGASLDASAATPRDERPSLDDLGGDDQSDALNHMAQHPPAYYVAIGLPYWALEAVTPVESASADRTMATLRLLNLPLVLGVPLVSAWAASRAGLGRSIQVLAALVPVCIPGLAHIGSAVNNDNLATLLAGLATALAVGIARGDERGRSAAALGLVVGLGLFTKAFSVVLLVTAALAYVGLLRATSDRRRVLRNAGLTVALIGAGGLWYVVSLVRYGEALPTIDDARFATAPAGFEPSLPDWASRFFGYIAQGFWGRPGAFDIKLPNPYTLTATIVLLVLVVLGGRRLRRDGDVLSVILLAFVFPATLVVVAVNSYRLYATSGLNAFVHGRYLMPGVVGLAVLAAVGLDAVLGRRARWAPWLLLAAAVLMHRMSVLRLLERYWGSPDAPLLDRVHAVVDWSPWPAGATAGLALLTVLGGAWSAWTIFGAGRGTVAAVGPQQGK